MVEGEKGKPFFINETGWGEFEITIKLYYVPESGEKPQTLYHHLRLHPYGRDDAEREAMRTSGEVLSWVYEDQIFNEPYEAFYDTLTSGAGLGAGGNKPGGGKGKSKAAKEKDEAQRSEGGVLERSAMIPMTNRPGQPFSRETEQLETKKLKEALVKVEEMTKSMIAELDKRQAKLSELKAKNATEGAKLDTQK